MMRNNSILTIYSDSDNFYYYKTFVATYFQPIIYNSRNLYEMKFEGRFHFMLSMKEIDKFFSSDPYITQALDEISHVPYWDINESTGGS